jgi:F0F1-type ATP synthase membrane subunit c/vacuolar-type H+-ATPase subunit K
MRCRAATRGVAILVGLCTLALAAPPAGLAARLVGGRTQQAIARTFSAQRSHRGQAIVSIRTSTVNGSWAVVRSVTPQAVGQTRSGATPPLRSTYYHLMRGGVRAAPPPKGVRTDLSRAFEVEVVYTGSGREAIRYTQNYGSVCAGQGPFTDTETDTVRPMAWSVRYVVDLDDLLSAVRGPAGTTLVPNVTFDAARSHVTATETVHRSVQDFGCNGQPTSWSCTTAFAAGGPDPGGELSFPAGAGLQAGLPMTARHRGSCASDNFTLGPSLWDSGGATAIAGTLGLVGGTLPARPYAPVKVTWPTGSAGQAQGFAASPCAGDTAACTDTFQWGGTVSLQPLSG